MVKWGKMKENKIGESHGILGQINVGK